MNEEELKYLDRAAEAAEARLEHGCARAGQDATKAKKRDKHDVHGWVILDKPVGMTSTHAVSVVKRLFTRKARRSCRHARSARFRRAANCAWRSHQDRSVRDGWSQAVSIHCALGRGTRHRRRRGPRRRAQRSEAVSRRDPSAAADFYRLYSAGAAALFGHQDRGRARL